MSDETVRGWFAGRIPDGWFTGRPEVTADREEVLIIGTLPDVDLGTDADPSAVAAARAGRIRQFREDTREARAPAVAAARAGRIRQFREDTREARVRIAREAEMRFRRKVSWGATCGDVTELFTTLSMPVMTRLRMPERRVLDTLVDAGVARSRSHALAWCVRLVGEHEGEWIDKLRRAMSEVEKVRAEGPGTGSV